MADSDRTRFLKLLVLLNGAVPILLLGWDAMRGELGANAVNYAIRTTGMLSLIFLALTLAVTPVRRWTGVAILVSGRRMLGLYAFFYALIHVGIYVALDRAGDLQSTLSEVRLRPYLHFGVIAVVSMIPLAVTSTNSMIERLGPRNWKRLHRLTYIACIAGGIHYFMLVKADIRLPVAFLCLFGIFLTARTPWFVREKNPRVRRSASQGNTNVAPWRGELQVVQTQQETWNVRTFRFALADGTPLPFQSLPGQFLTLQLDLHGKRVNRSYTISSCSLQRSYVEITVKHQVGGEVSTYLHEQVRTGDRLRVIAPLGRFVFEGKHEKGVVLIAGGVGITPIMSMLRSLREKNWTGEIYLFYFVRTSDDVIFSQELNQWAQVNSKFHLKVMITQSSDPNVANSPGRRLTKDLLRSTVPDLTNHPAYICGPNAMMDEVTNLLIDCQVPKSRIHTEAFSSGKRNSPGPIDFAPGMESGLQDMSLHLSLAGETVTVAPGETLLEAAEGAGKDWPFECRSGFCGLCKVKLVRGSVKMETSDALADSERLQGWILACQAKPECDVEVER